MSGFLLDTNCISELVRPAPDPRVVEWLETAEEAMLHISVLTLGEIRKGVAALPQTKRRKRLEDWLDVDLRTRFAGRILPVDDAVAQRWGLLSTQAKRNGTPLPIIDGLLAATALHHGLTIVSRNTSDSLNAQVDVLNLWRV